MSHYSECGIECFILQPSSPLRREVESVEASQMGLIHPMRSHSFWPLEEAWGPKGMAGPSPLGQGEQRAEGVQGAGQAGRFCLDKPCCPEPLRWK